MVMVLVWAVTVMAVVIVIVESSLLVGLRVAITVVRHPARDGLCSPCALGRPDALCALCVANRSRWMLLYAVARIWQLSNHKPLHHAAARQMKIRMLSDGEK